MATAGRRETYSDFDGLTSEDVDTYLGSGTASGSNWTEQTIGWEADYDMGKNKHHKGVRTKTKGGGKYSSVANIVPKCRHFHKAFELPNGIVVQASSYDHHQPSERRTPDFGLYCDHIWNPTWRAEFINFPDYRAPKVYDTAAEAIVEAYGRAADGWSVEAGCIGGHGRTGTVLACWVVLATGWNPQDAMQYVWEHYCKEAIESKEQVRFIDWFAEYVELFGLTGGNTDG